MKNTIYVDIYTELRNKVIQHLDTCDYKNPSKRKMLAKQFYDAERVTYNIEEKELHEFLCGSGDPIYEVDYVKGQEYIDFLLNTIKVFNSILPDSAYPIMSKYEYS
jgi:hypothetical protein